MDIQVLTPAIGAVIKDVDLSRGLNDAEVADIRKALLKHLVIFFEDQHLTPVQHRDFAARFGGLHTHPLYPGVEDAKELFILDNHAGNPTDNDAWHTDVTFIETPPMGSILYAKHLPAVGGDTVWSSMRAAYLGLSAPFREFLKGLDAVHDFARGFPTTGTVAKAAGEDKHAKARAEHPPVGASGDPLPSRNGRGWVVRQFRIHLAHTGREPQGECGDPEAAARTYPAAGISGALALDTQCHRLLGQSRDAALRCERLSASPPDHAPRDDHG